MSKHIPNRLRRLGRPSMNITRRCVGLTEEDYAWLKEFGTGSFSAGVRHAIQILRKQKGPQ